MTNARGRIADHGLKEAIPQSVIYGSREYGLYQIGKELFFALWVTISYDVEYGCRPGYYDETVVFFFYKFHIVQSVNDFCLTRGGVVITLKYV